MAMRGSKLGSRVVALTGLGVAIAAPSSLLGCQPVVPVVAAAFGLDQTPRTLYEPQVADWSLQRVTGTKVRLHDYQRSVWHPRG
jgi:hypothetical protein